MQSSDASNIDDAKASFIEDRLRCKLLDCAHFLMIRGASPVEIDEALTDFGFEMGPLEAQDLSGLEQSYHQRKKSGIVQKSKSYLESGLMISDRMVQEGRMGKISGVGWYRYPGGKGKVEDPLLEDLIREEAHFAGIKRVEYSSGQLLENLLNAMGKEAIKIMKQDASISSRDIDQVSIELLTFPQSKGGLMQYLAALVT